MTLATQTNFTTVDPSARLYTIGNAYFLAPLVSTALTGTSEQNLLLIQNPNTNAKSLYLALRRFVLETASATAIFRFYANATAISGGSALAILSNRANAAPAASLMTATKAPTATQGTKYLGSMVSNPFAPDVSQDILAVDPNNNLLVTVQLSGNATVSGLVAWWEV